MARPKDREQQQEKFDLENYKDVQERLEELLVDFPLYTIQTFLRHHDSETGEVIFEARIFRTPEDVAAGVYTSGWAHEVEGVGYVNRTSHLENCETSAIGRALANMGYGVDANRPSRSEMVKVARAKREHAAYIEYIRRMFRQIPDDFAAQINGQTVNLKEFIKTSEEIGEKLTLARQVVLAVEVATGTRFMMEGEESSDQAA